MSSPRPSRGAGPGSGPEESAEQALRAAYVCRLRKDTSGAIRQCERAVQLDPTLFAAFELLSDLFRDQARWDEAVATLARCTELQPQNADLAAKIERLCQDRDLFTRPVIELVRERPVGPGALLRGIFLRPDPVWYRSGLFHQLLAALTLLFVLGILHGVSHFGAAGWGVLALNIGLASWVAYDAHTHGEPPWFWAPLALLGSLFGFLLYLTVRGMDSGYGQTGGNRYFQG